MQIRVDKLRKNLALLQPVVPRKPTLPALTNVCLKDGHFTATDLETTVDLNLPEAQEAVFLMPHKAVLELLKYVPGDEILTLEHNAKTIGLEGVLKLTWNGGSASFEVPALQDYPETTSLEAESSGPLNGDKLVRALATALPYCATDAARPVLSGVTLYLGNVLQIAAADGFRLSYESLKLEYPAQRTIVIPAGTIRILEHLWRKEPTQVRPQNGLVAQLTSARQLQLSLWEGSLGIRFGNISLVSKLVEGTPPDHLALLNNFQEPIKVRLMAPELYNAVRRLAGIANDSTGVVRLLWTETRMTVSAKSEEKGEVQAEIPVEAGSNPGRIAVNVKYLLEYLAGKEGLITLENTNDTTPVIFHYGAKPIVAIMPMNVQWGDEKPANEPAETESTETENGTESADANGETGQRSKPENDSQTDPATDLGTSAEEAQEPNPKPSSKKAKPKTKKPTNNTPKKKAESAK